MGASAGYADSTDRHSHSRSIGSVPFRKRFQPRKLIVWADPLTSSKLVLEPAVALYSRLTCPLSGKRAKGWHADRAIPITKTRTSIRRRIRFRPPSVASTLNEELGKSTECHANATCPIAPSILLGFGRGRPLSQHPLHQPPLTHTVPYLKTRRLPWRTPLLNLLCVCDQLPAQSHSHDRLLFLERRHPRRPGDQVAPVPQLAAKRSTRSTSIGFRKLYMNNADPPGI